MTRRARGLLRRDGETAHGRLLFGDSGGFCLDTTKVKVCATHPHTRLAAITMYVLRACSMHELARCAILNI